MGFFDVAYEGVPTWDIGRLQPAVVRLADSGAIEGSVLDVGCGAGEHALFLADRGHEVVGIDLARAAVDRARAKARERRLQVEFLVWDALRLVELGRTFDTALDVGLFHSLGDDERAPYEVSLGSAVRHGGRLFLLCWSERNEWGFGPRRVTGPEIRAVFARGWTVEGIEEETLDSRLEQSPIHAWLACLTRC